MQVTLFTRTFVGMRPAGLYRLYATTYTSVGASQPSAVFPLTTPMM